MNDKQALQQLFKEQTTGFLSDIDVNKTACLSKPARALFYHWLGNETLANIYSRATIYRHRKEIKEKLGAGIDVAKPCPDPKRVVPETMLCTLRPVQMPAWYDLPKVI